MYIFKYSSAPIFWNNDGIDKPWSLENVVFQDFLPEENKNVNFVEQYTVNFSCEKKNITYISIFDDEINETNYYFVNEIIAINQNVITYRCELDLWFSKITEILYYYDYDVKYYTLSYSTILIRNPPYPSSSAFSFFAKIPFSDEYRIECTHSEALDFDFWNSYTSLFKRVFNSVILNNELYSSPDCMKDIYNFITKSWESYNFTDNTIPKIVDIDVNKFKESGVAFIYKLNINGVTNFFAIPQTKNIIFDYKNISSGKNVMYFNKDDFFNSGLPKDESYVGIMYAPKFIDFLISTPKIARKLEIKPSDNPSAQSHGTNFYVNFIYQKFSNEPEQRYDFYSAQGFNLNYFFDVAGADFENNFFIMTNVNNRSDVVSPMSLQDFYNDFYFFGSKIHPALFTHQEVYTPLIDNLNVIGFNVNLSFNEYNFSFSNKFIAFDFPKKFNDVTQAYANFVNSTYNSYNTSLSIFKENRDAQKWQNNFNSVANAFQGGVDALMSGKFFSKLTGVVSLASGIASNAASTEFNNQNLERQYNNSVNSLNASRDDFKRSMYGSVTGLGQENSVALNFVNNWFFCYSKPLTEQTFYNNAGILFGVPRYNTRRAITKGESTSSDFDFYKLEIETTKLTLLQNKKFIILNKNFQAKIFEKMTKGFRIWWKNEMNVPILKNKENG